jgi:hypothetical protein
MEGTGMTDVDIARRLLIEKPMTRFELECALATSQQQANRILNQVGARIVGSKRAPWKGRPAPIYALQDSEPAMPAVSLANVSSVWDLGARV